MLFVISKINNCFSFSINSENISLSVNFCQLLWLLFLIAKKGRGMVCLWVTHLRINRYHVTLDFALFMLNEPLGSASNDNTKSNRFQRTQDGNLVGYFLKKKNNMREFNVRRFLCDSWWVLMYRYSKSAFWQVTVWIGINEYNLKLCNSNFSHHIVIHWTLHVFIA